MGKLTIALLSGGISSERQVSLSSGDQVYDALDKSKYDILRYDPKVDIARLVTDAPKVDAALIILHGPYGEDGTVQGLLDLLKIPYQGTGVLGSALAMNKLASKQIYEKSGLPVPAYSVVVKDQPFDTDQLCRQFGLPLVVKPVVGGSSVGMSIVQSPEFLTEALEKAFAEDDSVIIEAHIDGIEITAGIIGNQQLEALPLIEIIPNDTHEFFDYEAKYTPGITQEICPARIDAKLSEIAQGYAKIAHRALFCRGYSRTDLILKGNQFFVLETNTIPGMTANSLLPLAARTSGIEFSRLLDRLIDLALEGHEAKG